MRSSANPRRSAFLVVLAVTALSALAGCYTVLKHPPTAEVLEGGESHDGGARRDCFDCHGGTGPAFAYDPMVTYGFEYLDDDWYPWYAYPWWYRDYWYWDRYHDYDGGGGHSGGIGGGNAGGDEEDAARRRLWGRGTLYLPPSLPPVINTPVATPPGAGGAGSTQPTEEKDKNGNSTRTMKSEDSGSGSTGSGNTGSGNADQDKDKDKDKDKNEEKKKEDKKDDRNVWGRGGRKGGGQ